MYQTEEPDSIAETLRGLDKAIGEFRAIKDSLRPTFTSSQAENAEQMQVVEQPEVSTFD